MLMNGELPFRAEVSSVDGSSSSMKVQNAKIVVDGVETTLLDDEITLSTNTVEGDKTNRSTSILSIPVDNNSSPKYQRGQVCF